MSKMLGLVALAVFAVACSDATAPNGLQPINGPSFIVTLDTETGLGWVGKGDVQTPFGWNNKTMQDQHTKITFEYDNTTVYSWTCEWTTGPDHNTSIHTQSKTATRGIHGVLASDSRKTGQWTGWRLTGFSSVSGDDSAFVPSCPGNPAGGGNSGEKTVVEGSIVATGSGGLYAVWNNGQSPLPRRLLQ